MITDYIKEFVKNECNKTKNEFGGAFFEQHILVVKEYACKLADILGVDKEVVEISSYLHDISAVMDISTLSYHADQSAEIAESILRNKSFDFDKIETIKQTIKSHSVPIKIGEGTLEEVCLSNADAISQIINPSYWLYFAFSVRRMSYEQGIEWYRKKVTMNMSGLIEQAKDMIDDKRYQI